MTARVAAVVSVAAGLCVCLGQAATKAPTPPAPQPTTQPVVVKPPKPDVVPLVWQLKIEHEPLRSIQVRLPGKKKPQLFWYLRYTVTNQSGEDHIFIPEFILYTDSGQVIRAGRSVPTAVFYQIKKLHKDPLQKTHTAMTGKMLLGQDNAKTGVAIWEDFDPEAGELDIFIGGLSGETKAMPLPKPIKAVEVDLRGRKKMVMKTRVLLAKTLRLHYSIPGEASARPGVRPKLVKEDWVMR